MKKQFKQALSKDPTVGYDFDGVADHIELVSNSVIITGRPKADEKELREKVGDRPIYFFGDDKDDEKYKQELSDLHRDIAYFKSNKIYELGLTKFYEDTDSIVEILKDENPDVEIVHVKNKEKKNSKDKKSSEVIACVVDYGSFICLAEKMAETYKEVYYYTPTSQEFYSIDELVKADGLKNVRRVYDIFDPVFFDKIDLFIFPDIGYGGLQKYLRSVGKAVWGSMGADKIETFRTKFIETLKTLDLPLIHTETIKGLTKLREHLSGVKNKWIKVNQYRGNMETWHHIDIEHSFQELDRLAIEFGGLKDSVTFIVQDFIETDVEIGYDGWCVDGEFPEQSFQGYEKKNELYLGSLLAFDKLPEQVKTINKALSPLLKEYGYRNFIATEIRIKDDVPYFIDPTMRMPGQTGEQLLETCSNLPDVIWQGAQGKLIKPEFKYKFAAEATMHYTAGGEWKVLKVPDKIRQWVKMAHYCEKDGMCHFPSKSNDELGVVLGVGNTIEKAVSALMENLEQLSDEPIRCELDGFMDLIKDIREAEKFGITFTSQKIPDLTAVLKKD